MPPKKKSKVAGGGNAQVRAASTAGPKRQKTGGRSTRAAECMMCKNPWEMENPIEQNRDRVPTLQCSKGYGPCDICRSLKRKHAVEESDTAHAVTLDGSDEKRREWTVLFNVYVATKNGHDPTVVDGYAEQQAVAAKGPRTTIDAGQHLALIEQVHVSICWPKHDLVNTLHMEVNDSQLEMGTDKFGNQCRGMIRKASADDPDPLPRVVKSLFKEERHYRTQNKLLHSSDQNLRVGEGEARWEQERFAMDISVEEVGDAGALSSRLVSAAPQRCESDSDDFASIGTVICGARIHSAMAATSTDTSREIPPPPASKRKTASARAASTPGAAVRKSSPPASAAKLEKKQPRGWICKKRNESCIQRVRRPRRWGLRLRKKESARLEANVRLVYNGEDLEASRAGPGAVEVNRIKVAKTVISNRKRQVA